MTASYPADARDPRPLHDIARYDRLSLIATADKLLNEPQHLLRIPAGDLLDLADNPRGLAAYVKGKVGAGPTVFESMPKMGGPSSGSGAEDSMRSAARAVTAVIGFGAKKARANYKINQMLGLMRSFELARPVLSLTEQERGLFLAMVERVADKQTTPARWKRFLALLIWNGGKTALTPTTRADASHMAAVYVREFVSVVAPDHAMFLAEAGAECAHAAAN
ncbi:MAG: hypothetical protein JSR99_01330, partial [Proteobacteria bacterium]|nr:hypothetical protein [Pseudomonadota bacterium]